MLASLGFLAMAALAVDLGGMLSAIDTRSTLLLVLLSAGYGLALVLLAIAWKLILVHGEGRDDFASAFIVYGLSVVPKYLPGSVFQYASRQGLGARFGWAQREIAGASLAEIALHFIASLCVLLLCDRLLGLGQIGVVATILLAATIAAAMAWLIFRTPTARGRLILALVAQILFFFLLVLIAAGCAAALGAAPQRAMEAGAMFLLAWLLGFIAPGAPGGIGVREAGVVITVSAILGPGPALLFAAFTRVVTMGGDAVFALAALLVSRARKQAGVSQL
jgi:uncharacterized membrane protein YbhN (UPF0104 family)